MAVRETRPRGMRSMLHRGPAPERSVVCLICAVMDRPSAVPVPLPRQETPALEE